MEKQFWPQIILSLASAMILGLLFRLYSSLVAAPRQQRRVLQQQGVGGPPPALLLGNIFDLKKSRASAAKAAAAATAGPPPSHNYGAVLLSIFDGWRRQYGDMYTFSVANRVVLVVNNYDVINEMTTCTSLQFGKPPITGSGIDLKPLLGDGIVTSNGIFWAQQRKILASELFVEKVKGMTSLIQKSALMLMDSWGSVIDREGGRADIKIDDHLKKFSGDVISRACFGSSYGEGEQLFRKLGALQRVVANKSFTQSIPGMRYLPIKHNTRSWELQREVRELILRLVKQKNEASSKKNMVQMILEGAKSSNMSLNAMEKFTVDNCKSIYLAGYETTAIAASWCLMLLASNPEWQHRVRDEVVGLCKGKLPDFDSISQMKQLTMVINESLRLYPPVIAISRTTLNELEFSNIRIPKGVVVWIMIIDLHTDPTIWGADSYEFRPDRFANGTTGACKLPHLFMPFGFGPRICLGLNLAMVELKILLSLILSNFSFSLSSKYVHAPTMNLVLEPRNGIILRIEKLL